MPAEIAAIQNLLNQIHCVSADCKRRAASSNASDKLLLATRGLLRTLAEQGAQTVPAIAYARNTSRQNIQIMANRLVEVGCVEFKPNPRHKKSDLLHITPRGQALLGSKAEEETRTLEALSSHLNQLEVDATLVCLSQLRSALKSAGPDSVRVENFPRLTAKKAARPVRVEPTGRPPETVMRIPVPEVVITPLSQPLADEESLPINLL